MGAIAYELMRVKRVRTSTPKWHRTLLKTFTRLLILSTISNYHKCIRHNYINIELLMLSRSRLEQYPHIWAPMHSIRLSHRRDGRQRRDVWIGLYSGRGYPLVLTFFGYGLRKGYAQSHKRQCSRILKPLIMRWIAPGHMGITTSWGQAIVAIRCAAPDTWRFDCGLVGFDCSHF